jgi:hypothetical protein
VNLADLSKPQWDAAREAAAILCDGNPNRAAERERFRKAKAKLTALLPGEVDAGHIITQALRWEMLNAIASVMEDVREAA